LSFGGFPPALKAALPFHAPEFSLSPPLPPANSTGKSRSSQKQCAIAREAVIKCPPHASTEDPYLDVTNEQTGITPVFKAMPKFGFFAPKLVERTVHFGEVLLPARMEGGSVRLNRCSAHGEDSLT
jgi:hypothetical protein